MRFVAMRFVVVLTLGTLASEHYASQLVTAAEATADTSAAGQPAAAVDNAQPASKAAPADSAGAQFTSEIAAADAEYVKAAAAIGAENDQKLAAAKTAYDEVAKRSRDAYLKVLEGQRDGETKAGNQQAADAIGRRIALLVEGPPRNEVQKLWAASFLAEYNKDYDGSVAALEKIMQATGSSQNAFIQVRLGWLRYLGKKYDQAATAYQTASKLAPKSITPLQGLFNCYLALNRTDDAIEAAQGVLKLDPLNYLSNKKLGDLYYAKGDFTHAGAYYQRLVTTYVDDLPAATSLAWCYLKLDQTALAVKIFGDVLAVQPDNALALSGFAAATQPKPLAAATGSTAEGKGRIVIQNPKSSSRPVSYTLNGQYPVTLQPGNDQTLDPARSWTIHLDQAGQGNAIQQRLEAGRYDFAADGNQWKLSRQPR